MSNKLKTKSKKSKLTSSTEDDLDTFLDKEIESRKLEELETKREKQTDSTKDVAQNGILKAQNEKTVMELVKIADEMWKKLKELIKADKTFVDLEDKKKLEYFKEKLDYKEFMTEFPIVTRYLICMGQYSSKALSRMLEKLRTMQHPPPDKREKGYMEDQWVRRQADYIRYLWEAYQKGHYNTAEAKWVWEDSYQKLKGEFDDFRNKYKSIEENVKDEKEKIQTMNVKELLERLKTGKQQLNDDEANHLLILLTNKLYKRRYCNTMLELLKEKPCVLPTCEGTGTGPEEEKDDPSKPRIRMIEHVDESQIDKVPKELLLDKRTASELSKITGLDTSNALGTVEETEHENEKNE